MRKNKIPRNSEKKRESLCACVDAPDLSGQNNRMGGGKGKPEMKNDIECKKQQD